MFIFVYCLFSNTYNADKSSYHTYARPGVLYMTDDIQK